MSNYEPQENEVVTKSARLNEKDNGSTYFQVSVADVGRLVSILEQYIDHPRGARFGFNIVPRQSEKGEFLSAQMYIDEVGEYSPQGARKNNTRSAGAALGRAGRRLA